MQTNKTPVKNIIRRMRRRYLLAYLMPGAALSAVTFWTAHQWLLPMLAHILSLAVLCGYLLWVRGRHHNIHMLDGVLRLAETVVPGDAEEARKMMNDIHSLSDLGDYLNRMILDEQQRQTVYQQSLENLNQELNMVNRFIENSSVVLFEWPVPQKTPAQFVSGSITYFGYSEEEFLSGKMAFYDLVHPEDVERVRRTNEKARETNLKDYTHMYRILLKNGEVKWVEDWTVLVRGEAGKCVSERSILRDVTHEVNLNVQMNESEARFQELFENAGAIIFTCDFDGVFTSANRACLTLFGYDLPQLKSMTVYDLLKKTDGDLDLSDLQYMETYLTEPVELKVRDAEGHEHILEARNSLLFKEDLPNEIQTVALDITERKKAEAQVHYLTYHDRLTGLYNRLYFDRLTGILEKDPQLPLAVIIGDMNGLKLTNDAFGHKAGDQLLVRMSGILQQAVDGIDALIARLSGDEFAILLPDVPREKGEAICEKIRALAAVSEEAPIRPSIALGCGYWDSEAMSLEEVIREAEDNMYHNKLNESKSIRSAIIQSLQTSLEEKTTETREHAERLRKLAVNLGFRLGLAGSRLDELALAAVMHDIGKIGIPDHLLVKAEPLDPEEWQIMQKHPEIGYHIILSSPNMAKVAEFILAHHERWDGKGYPRALKGEDIPLISRIIAVVDAYDVMTNGRPYRIARSAHEALGEIERNKGTQFDPTIAAAFIEMIRQMEGL